MKTFQYFNFKNKNSGFMALVSMLILSTVLVMLMLANSTSTFFARFDVLGKENKVIAENLAQSCINTALLKLAEDYNYDPLNDSYYQTSKGVPVNVGLYTCFIVSTNPGGPRSGNFTNVTITTSASHHKSFSTFRVLTKVLNPSQPQSPAEPNISIISWEEV